jgi:hypothetical protein
MLHAWEEDTREAYGAGLLRWHCFCNGRGIPEQERAPASQALLSIVFTKKVMSKAYSYFPKSVVTIRKMMTVIALSGKTIKYKDLL